MSAKNQLIVLWWSIIFTTIFGIAWFLIIGFFPPPSPALDAAEVVRIYTEHNLAIRIGVALCLLCGGFLMPWSLVISLQMERIENGKPDFVWSRIQRLGGALGVSRSASSCSSPAGTSSHRFRDGWAGSPSGWR